MKFNVNDYRGKFVMHCKTKEEAIDFVRINGLMPDCFVDYWDVYEENTCYSFNFGAYCREYYYKTENYKILEWSDFMNKGDKNMKKESNVLLPSDVESVIFNNRNTVVTLTDGRKGVAKCDIHDEFDPYTGFTTAYYKAHYDKNFELKKMFNNYMEFAKKKGYKQTIIRNK